MIVNDRKRFDIDTSAKTNPKIHLISGYTLLN